MQSRTIAIIAAVAAGNGAIGFKGGIPWDSPEDRAIFARKTAGGVLVCGWNTAGEVCRAVDPDIRNRVLLGISGGGIVRLIPAGGPKPPPYDLEPYSLESVAAEYPDRNIWICGGARLYAEAMRNPLVTEMHISHMDGFPDADTFFPRFDTSGGLRGIVAGGSKWDVVSTVDGKEFSHRVYRRI